jgi:peptidyl-prolyl cis-trans isomerase SurA
MLRLLRASFAGFLMLLFVVPVFAASFAVTVNGEGITTIQVSQRLALFKLEGKSGAKAATDELINEMLMIQEATRLGFNVTDAEVDEAYLQIARNLKVSPSNLDKILTTNGVDPATLRGRLKANVAWGKVVGSAVSAKVTVSDAEVEAEAETQLNATNSFDYMLREVLFIVIKGGDSASKRTAQANKFRQSYFKGCDTIAQDLDTGGFVDAAVRQPFRKHATQFPDALAQELAKLNVGQITKPRVVETGVQMLAVCAKSVSEDSTFLQAKLRQQTGNAKLKAEAEKYLQDLKAKAAIIYS